MDTSSKVAVAALIVVGLSVAMIAYYPFLIRGTYWPLYGIEAHVLTQKPDKFIQLDNPDPVISQAISNPEKHFMVKQDETQIVSLIREHGTSNIAVNGSYYEIGVVFIDTGPPTHLAAIYPISCGVLTIAVISLIITLLVKAARKYPPKRLQEK
jgi:hypothetical protein